MKPVSPLRTSMRRRGRVVPEIRHVGPADAEAVTRIFAGPQVVAGTLQVPFPSLEVWRKRVSQPEPGSVSLAGCMKGEVVGLIGIHGHADLPRKRHVAWIGMAVRDDWQGRGIGSALMRAAMDLADNWLQLLRIELQVFPDNTAAIRLYQRHGFEVEGTMRQAAFRAGRLEDVLMMARLRPDKSVSD